MIGRPLRTMLVKRGRPLQKYIDLINNQGTFEV